MDSMELSKKFELQKCKNKIKYQIKHEDVPIKLDPNLDEAIKYLLWYVPNINSEQAKKRRPSYQHGIRRLRICGIDGCHEA